MVKKPSVQVNSNLSKDMMKNIDNYGKAITHIEGTINQIRARPGMYIGPINAAGLLNMFREIFQNAVDQLLSKDSPCDFISVVFDIRYYEFTVLDNGMGIPFDKMVQIYTEGHTGKNLGKKAKGDYSAGTNGIGAKATNALSAYFDVMSYRYDGSAKHVRFEKGVLKKEENIKNKECYQGTAVTFAPDHTVMGETPLHPGLVYQLIIDTLSLLPIGSRILYKFIDKNGKESNEELINRDGIASNVIMKSQSMLIPPIMISRDTGDMKLEVAFTFDQKDLNGEDISSYANTCPTSTVPANTHVSGTLDGITSWFCNYMNKTYLANAKTKLKTMPVDVKMGLKLMISAFHLEPIFTGQAKEVFSNSDFKPFAKAVVTEGLNEWAKAKPQDLLKVCKYLKDVGMIRLRSEDEKVKVTAKYETSSVTGLPAKYAKPSGPASLGWELFIVEGDSAAGSAKTARDPKTQGIFPIRGKILNAWQASPAKIAANAEIMGIAKILGGGYGKNFDISKVKFKKIIFMTDADRLGPARLERPSMHH